MKILRISHVGIAVKSLDQASRFYGETLGIPAGDREIVEEQKVAVAMHPLGESCIELLEPTDPLSPIARFLNKRGPGVHHLCLEVEDLQGLLRELKARGVRLIDEIPRTGAGGCQVAFIHPESTQGVLIELNEEMK
ncbi:MAG: methylmalonyl-CoA epimerase [Acidobacteriia bacterium]|nr:methylmalonyl-CoA epimerase [Terriglobia bacterium]